MQIGGLTQITGGRTLPTPTPAIPALGTVMLHSTAHNSSDSLPYYPADNHHSSDI